MSRATHIHYDGEQAMSLCDRHRRARRPKALGRKLAFDASTYRYEGAAECRDCAAEKGAAPLGTDRQRERSDPAAPRHRVVAAGKEENRAMEHQPRLFELTSALAATATAKE